MIASLALRSRCCDWHAYYNAPSEHAACVVCDEPMPLVRVSFFPCVDEPICPRCVLSLRLQIMSLRIEHQPRFLRRQPVPRRTEPTAVRATAPLPQFTNRLRLRDPRGREAQGGSPHVRT